MMAYKMTAVAYRYAFWVLSLERMSRDPDASVPLRLEVEAAMERLKPRMTDKDLQDVKFISELWPTWEVEALDSLMLQMCGPIMGTMDAVIEEFKYRKSIQPGEHGK